MTKDRLPPYDEAAEKAVIGCCVTTPAESIPETALLVQCPEFFYDERCQTAWRVLREMEPAEINTISVASRMATIMGQVKASLFLGECQDAAFSSANLPSWLHLVESKWLLRRVISVATTAIAGAYDSFDAMETLDRLEREVLKIRPAREAERDLQALLQDAASLIEFRSRNWDAVTGLSTGLCDLDKLSDGLHPGELIVIAALPSCGKTALALNIAVHNALKGIPVGILSAEMRPVQLVIRSICSESRVNFRHLCDRDVVTMVHAMARLRKAPIYIQQSSGWTINQAQACARRWHQRHGIRLLVGDYIQKFQGVGENREQRVASIGSGFKVIAMELEIPVIAPSQLNDDGRLRESRALGQDGDSVWKLANDGKWEPHIQPMKLKIEKCRDGETGEVDLTFFKTSTRFESASKIHDEDVPRTSDP